MKKRALSLFMTLTMVIGFMAIYPTTSLTAAPADLNRAACYTAAEGNIARLPSVRQITNTTDARYNPLTGAGIDRTGINANYNNDSYGVPSVQVMRVTDGNRPASGTSNGYLAWSYTDTFGVNNRLYFVLNWGQPVVIDAVRCDWWTDSNVTVPSSEARVEWLDGTVWREVTNMRNPVTGAAVTNIGTLAMGNWNPVTFDPVVTTQLRLRLHRNGTVSSGIGLGEWEVFGSENPAISDLSMIDESMFQNITANLTLPLIGAKNGSTITWSDSTNTALNIDGTITRPPVDTPDAIGTIKATAVNGENTGEKIFNFTVKAIDNLAKADLEALDINLLNLINNVSLPAVQGGSTLIWSNSTNTAAFGNDGSVTRPAVDTGNVSGTIQVSATHTATGHTYTRTLDWSVIENRSDNAIVTHDLAWLDIGSTTNRTTSFVFPPVGDWGSTITWDVGSTSNLWKDGTVIRPPVGQPDVTITLVATITANTVTRTKEWTVTIPALVGMRTIASVDTAALNIESPFGMAPLLPTSILVTYSDGTKEYRRCRWDNTAKATERLQAGMKVDNGTYAPDPNTIYVPGYKYQITGRLNGEGSPSGSVIGYPLTANITVVDKPFEEPALTALPLPLKDVSMLGDTNTNYLIKNMRGTISYLTSTITNQTYSQYFYNYRYFYGLPTTWNLDGTGGNLTATSGWDNYNADDKIKGHGMGHYLTGLANAWKSGQATEAQKTILKERMARIVDEVRYVQELTFTPAAEAGFASLNSDGYYLEARDLYPTPANVMAMTFVRSGGANGITRNGYNGGTSYSVASYRDPKTYGYGFAHGFVPESLIINERYAGYGSGATQTWAPFYALHKQFTGWNGTYEAFIVENDPELKATANKALDIARDMGLWIWNRYYYRTFSGDRPNTTTPGYRDWAWRVYIGGENGGIEDALTVTSSLLRERNGEMPADHPYAKTEVEAADKILAAATCFDNKRGYNSDADQGLFNDLEHNADPIRSRHANQHIPQIVGALKVYREMKLGNKITPVANVIQPYSAAGYWNIANNFFHMNDLRYAHSMGGMGNGEMWPGTPYTQAANSSTTGCETCCVHNLLKVSMNLNIFKPDDAQYMDFYERILYGQMIGSMVPGSTSNQVSYTYNIGQNITRSRGGGNASGHCCNGTGVENATKYQEAAYFSTLDNNTLYVALYMPTEARWDRGAGKGVTTISNKSEWPSETNTFKIESVGTNRRFNLKFRIPYWATMGYTIQINKEPAISGKDFRKYYDTGVRTWNVGDTITVKIPFPAHIYWAGDTYTASNNGVSGAQWAGSLVYGPMVMAATNTGTSTWRAIPIDSYMGNITRNAPITLNGTGSMGNAPSIYTLTTPGHLGTGTPLTFQPHYAVGNAGWNNANYTTYFQFLISGNASALFKTALFEAIERALSLNPVYYTPESYALLTNALAAAVLVYQNDNVTQAQVDAAIAAIQAAIDQLIQVGGLNLTALQAAVAAARVKAPVGFENTPTAGNYTWDTFNPFKAQLDASEALLAQAAVDPSVVRQAEVSMRAYDLNQLTAALLHYNNVDRAGLKTALDKFNATDYDKQWAWYSWQEFKPILDAANAVHNNRTANQGEIGAALQSLENFILTPKEKEVDMVLYEAIKEMIAFGRSLDPDDYADKSLWGDEGQYNGILDDADTVVIYFGTGGLQPNMVPGMYTTLKEAIEKLSSIKLDGSASVKAGYYKVITKPGTYGQTYQTEPITIKPETAPENLTIYVGVYDKERLKSLNAAPISISALPDAESKYSLPTDTVIYTSPLTSIPLTANTTGMSVRGFMLDANYVPAVPSSSAQ